MSNHYSLPDASRKMGFVGRTPDFCQHVLATPFYDSLRRCRLAEVYLEIVEQLFRLNHIDGSACGSFAIHHLPAFFGSHSGSKANASGPLAIADLMLVMHAVYSKYSIGIALMDRYQH